MILSLETLQKSFTAFNKQIPINYKLFREETEDAYETNLKNGIISEEEYERFMASLDQYATIGEEEIDPVEASQLEVEKQQARELIKKMTKNFKKKMQSRSKYNASL